MAVASSDQAGSQSGNVSEHGEHFILLFTDVTINEFIESIQAQKLGRESRQITSKLLFFV